MASKTLFQSIVGKMLPQTTAVNEAGGTAYQLSAEQALAQYAATGCLSGTFYATGDEQLAAVLKLCDGVSPEFIARTALYARTQGYMKDMPALLLAVLSVKGPGLLAEVFDRVVDSPKMLRNFVQIMRSGVVGRKSLGTLPKRLIQEWLAARSDEQLFVGSIGNDPSLADIIKMVHPKPATPARQALLAYLIGRDHDSALLPDLVQQYERIKRQTVRGQQPVPNVPFQMLTSLPLTRRDWEQIARNASWQMTRMNLNTLLRHGVFENRELVGLVANRLRNPRLVADARVFPYQLLAAYANIAAEVPGEIREALQDAMELAIGNVPHVPGKIYVFPDVSGSMHSPVTGHRAGATTKVRCIDVAALVAAAVLRRNPQAEVVPFESNVVQRNDQRPAFGVAAVRRNELQRAAGSPEPAAGERGPRDLRLGQRVVDRYEDARPLRRRRDRNDARVGEVPGPQSAGEDDLHRHSAVGDHAGGRAGRHHQRRRVQRPGLLADCSSRQGKRRREPLGSSD